METYWLNIGSFILGVVACGIPLVDMLFGKKGDFKRKSMATGLSIGACAMTLWMQIFYMKHLVGKGDVTALMDTIDAVAFLGLGLLGVTLVLNGLMFIVVNRRNERVK